MLGVWKYIITGCTPEDYSLKFPGTPPASATKIWEVIVTPEDIKIKCDTFEVLHFIFKNGCTSRVKGKKATQVKFKKGDNATKEFRSGLVGKYWDTCVDYIIIIV